MGMMVSKSKEGSSADWSDDGEEILADINITPLVDIFLVLLIIFMVSTSVMSQMGVDVTLPKASATASSSQPEGVIVTLMKGGGLKINGVTVASGDWDTFREQIQQGFTKTSSHLVVLEGDQEAFLGSAVTIMDQARKAGADRFAIATQPGN